MTTQVEGQTVKYIPVDQVDVHRLNPRKDPGDITELAESIRQQGVLLPILVVRDNGGYAAVHGSRRLAATRLAGLTEIPAIVSESMTDAEISEIAIVENLQREDLNALEVAEGYKTYLETVKGSTVTSLAERLGKPVSSIRNTLRLLKAPSEIKEELKRGNLTAAHVKVILSLADPSLIDDLEIWQDTSVEDLQRQVEDLNRDYRLKGPEAAAAAKQAIARTQELYPNATITWHTAEAVGAEGENGVPLEKLLGKPSKEIVLGVDITTAARTKQHDKICGCVAMRIVPAAGQAKRGRGQIDELTFTSERVCVDPDGARKFRIAQSDREEARGAKAAAAGKPKNAKRTGPTKAQKDAEIAKRAKEMVANPWANVYGRRKDAGKVATLSDRLAKHKEIDRLVLYALVDFLGAPSYAFHTWETIRGLKIAKVRELIKDHAIQNARILSEPYGKDKKADRGQLALLTAFGVKPTELGYVDPSAEKVPAKKKAKR